MHAHTSKPKFVEVGHVTQGTCKGCANMLKNAKWGAVKCTKCDRCYCRAKLRGELLVCSFMREEYQRSGMLCHCEISAVKQCPCQPCVKRARRKALKRSRQAAREDANPRPVRRQRTEAVSELPLMPVVPAELNASVGFGFGSGLAAPSVASEMRVCVMVLGTAAAGKVVRVPSSCQTWAQFQSLLAVEMQMQCDIRYEQIVVSTADGRFQFSALSDIRDNDTITVQVLPRVDAVASPVLPTMTTPGAAPAFLTPERQLSEDMCLSMEDTEMLLAMPVGHDDSALLEGLFESFLRSEDLFEVDPVEQHIQGKPRRDKPPRLKRRFTTSQIRRVVRKWLATRRHAHASRCPTAAPGGEPP